MVIQPTPRLAVAGLQVRLARRWALDLSLRLGGVGRVTRLNIAGVASHDVSYLHTSNHPYPFFRLTTFHPNCIAFAYFRS
jgi:hypothetical protein